MSFNRNHGLLFGAMVPEDFFSESTRFIRVTSRTETNFIKYLSRDLQVLLKMPFNHFISHVLCDENFQKTIQTFFLYAPRIYDPKRTHHHQTSSFRRLFHDRSHLLSPLPRLLPSRNGFCGPNRVLQSSSRVRRPGQKLLGSGVFERRSERDHLRGLVLSARREEPRNSKRTDRPRGVPTRRFPRRNHRILYGSERKIGRHGESLAGRGRIEGESIGIRFVRARYHQLLFDVHSMRSESSLLSRMN